MMKPLTTSLIFFLLLASTGCKNEEDKDYVWKTVLVNVSAYNSVRSQTDSIPNVAAWGDTLRPGMKSIAISRDLLDLGLDYDTQVIIQGMEGVYMVKDKMHPKWRHKIDIYMGEDVQGAREWGRKKLKIRYRVKKDSIEDQGQ